MSSLFNFTHFLRCKQVGIKHFDYIRIERFVIAHVTGGAIIKYKDLRLN